MARKKEHFQDIAVQGLYAAGSFGTAGQVLKSDGDNVYWTNETIGDATTLDGYDSTAFAILASANKFTQPITVNVNPLTTGPALPTGTLLHLIGTNATQSRMYLDTFGANAAFLGRRANGTNAAPSAILSGDFIFTFGGFGYGTTGYIASASALGLVTATENFTDTAAGAKFSFRTIANGTITPLVRWHIENDGSLIAEGLTVTGNGTLNAVDYFDNGVNINTIYADATNTLTMANKTLTNPTINAAALSGTFSGAVTRTGIETFNLNAAAAPAAFAGTIIHVVQADAANPRILLDGFGAQPTVTLRRASGTNASKTAILSGEAIGNVNGMGYGSSGYSANSRVALAFLAAENWTDSAQGTRIIFSTSTNTTASSSTRWGIENDGSFVYNGGSVTGNGTVNAIDYFDNGVNINTIYGSLATTNTWELLQTYNAGIKTTASGSATHISIERTGASPSLLTIANSGNQIDFDYNLTGYRFLLSGSPRLSITGASTFTYNGNTIWHAGNDGAGSGLDADLLDGYSSNDFARLAGTANFAAKQTIWPTGTTGGGGLVGVGEYLELTGFAPNIVFTDLSASVNPWFVHYNGTMTIGETVASVATTRLALTTSTIQYNGSTVWHAGNDGSGSGLDADTLDGYQASSLAILASANIFTASQTIQIPGSTALLTVGGTTASSAAQILLRGAAATFRYYAITTGSGLRWVFGSDNTAESGSNAGSNFFLQTYDDAGTYLGGVFSVIRSNRVLNFNATPTAASNTMWHAGNDGAGSGLDADLLDGINSSSFLRSDIAQQGGVVYLPHDYNTYPSVYNVSFVNHTGSSNLPTGMASVNAYRFIMAGGDTVARGVDFVVTQENPNANVFVRERTYGGWSKLWHNNNDGAGSGLDADLLDGLNASSAAGASTIVARDANGYIFSNYINTTDDSSPGSISYVVAKFGDNYHRSATALKVNTFLQSGTATTFLPVGGYTASNQWGANTLANMNIAAGTGAVTDQRTGFFTANNPTNSPNGDWVHWINHFGYSWGTGAEYGFQIAHGFWANTMWVRKINNGVWGSWVKLWTADNDGAGSGLDADTLDGYNIGLSGGTIGLLNGNNTYSGISTHTAEIRWTSPPINSRMLGMPWAEMSSDASGNGVFGNNLYANWDGVSVTYRTVNTHGSVGYGAIRFGYGATQVAAFGGATTADATVTPTWHTLWHSGSDGAGSGLDADLLDGLNSSAFGQLSAANVWTGASSTFNYGATGDSQIAIGGSNANNAYFYLRGNAGQTRSVVYQTGSSTRWQLYADTVAESGSNAGSNFHLRAYSDASASLGDVFTAGRNTLVVTFTNTPTVAGSAIWHAGNDGSGSGLDADLLDGQTGSYYTNASNITSGTLADARLPSSMASKTFTGVTQLGILDIRDWSTPDTDIDGLLPGSTSGAIIENPGGLNHIVIGIKGNDSSDGLYVIDTNNGGNVSYARLLLALTGSSFQYLGNTIWHAGNDGSGSGLNADLLDGNNIGTSGATIPLLNTNNTYSGISTFTGQVLMTRGAVPLQITTTVDNGNVEGFIIEGDRATPTANDIVYMAWKLSNSAGTQTEFGRQDIVASTVTAASEASYWRWSVRNAGSLTTVMRLSATALTPQTSDGLALGSTTLMWSDLFLASGAVVNFNNGDVTITHSTNTLAFAGASSGYTFDAALTVSGSTVWHAGNDGAGSGLDADLFDGVNSTEYVFGAGGGYGTTGSLTNMNTGAKSGFFTSDNPTNGPFATWTQWINVRGAFWADGSQYVQQIAWNMFSTDMRIRNCSNGTWGSWYQIWHSNSDGAGSGLDADLWDGNNFATYLNQAVLTSSSPSFAGLTMTGLIIGHASASTDVNAANDTGSFSCRGDGTTGKVASMSFHRTGNYAINMGLGADNIFRIGGWSASSNCLQLTGAGALTTLSTITAGGSIYAGSGHWFRSTGDTGWYSETWGGGTYMTDGTYVKIYNGKAFYVGNNIDATGNITAYYSDERLKTKSRNVENALDQISTLTPFFYFENELARSLGYNNQEEQIGISAQEVQRILPQVVHRAPVDIAVDENNNKYSKSGEEYLTVDYAKLVPLLIAAVKELKAEIEELRRDASR